VYKNDGTVETITADHILLAMGGRPVRPAIEGAELGIDSDGFFDLTELPPRSHCYRYRYQLSPMIKPMNVSLTSICKSWWIASKPNKSRRLWR
jgi:hypothetical protein